MARPFAVIGLTFLTALWAFGNTGEGVAIVCAGVFALLTVVSLSVKKLRKTIVFPCAFAAVLASCVSFITAAETSVKPLQELDGQTVTIAAHMTDLPKYTDAYTIYIVQTDSVDGRPIPFPMNVYCEDNSAKLSDVLVFRSTIRVGSTASAYVRDGLQIIPHKETLRSRMLGIRQYVVQTLSRALPGTTGAVLCAMLTGNSDDIPTEHYVRMRNSGILHLFSVSGFHLSVFSLALLKFLEKRKVPRVMSSVSAGVLVLFFTLVTGCAKPTIRAAIMLLVMLLGRCFFRRADALNSLGLSVLLLCLADPMCASDVGLLLSVLGLLSILIIAPVMDRCEKKLRFGLLRIVVSAMLISSTVGLVTLPVSLLLFGSVSLVAPLVNACILPAAECAMILAALGVLFSAWHPLLFLQKAVFLIAGLLSKYCVAVSDFFGGLRFSSMETPFDAAGIWIAGVLVLLAVSLLLTMPKRRKLMLTASVAAASLVLSGAYCLYSENGNVRITVLDAGNATSVLVQSDGETALIGSANAYRLRQYTDDLQLFLLPCLQATESADAVSVVRKIPTAKVIVPQRAVQTLPLFLDADPVVTTTCRETVGRVQLDYFYEKDASAVRLTMYGKSMLLLFAPGAQVQKQPLTRLSSDILFTRNDLPLGLSADDFGLTIVSCDAARSVVLPRAENILLTAGRGDIQLTVSREGLIHIERSAELA